MTRRPEEPMRRRREVATRKEAAAQRRAAAEARRRLLRERQAQRRPTAGRTRGTGFPEWLVDHLAARRARRATRPAHARRRRRLLAWSVLPAFVALTLALSMVPLASGYEEARALYDEGDHWGAVGAFDDVDEGSFVERWKGAFNRGTARYRAGAYTGAVRWLDEALAGAPAEHRCDVQNNRALALAGSEEAYRADADEQLEVARALAAALAARDAGEPYDEEALEPLDGREDEDEQQVLADEIGFAGYLLRLAADDAARAAEALTDPACTPPPSGGAEDDQDDQGGGGQDEQQDQGGQGGQDEQQDQAGQGGADARADAAAQAEQRMQELLDLAADLREMSRAAEEGRLDGVPQPGQGQGEAPDPAQAEEQRQAELAERNGQAGGGSGGGDASGEGSSGGGASGDEQGDGGGGSPRRNW